MKTLISIILIIIIFESCNSQTTNKILPVPLLAEVDTIRHGEIISTYRSDYFLIENCSENFINIAIEKFVSKNLDSNFLKFNQYDMYFYEKTEKLSIEIIKSYPEGLRYKAIQDEKLIKHYTWYNGKLFKYPH